MRRKPYGITQWAARMLCALALVFVGFGSQPSVSNAGDLTPAQLEQYRLPDGTLPVLCITYKDDDGTVHGKVHVPGCEACQMAAAVLLPAAPLADEGHLPFVVAKYVAPTIDAFHRQLYPPNCGPRAPPLRLIVA